jgi:AraC-like DNA-binding protein
MTFVSRAPSAGLRPFVRTLWYFACELPHRHERLLPTGRMQLLVNLDADELRTYHGPGLDVRRRFGGAILMGPHDGPFGIDTAEQRRVVGVDFHFGGAAPFFREPAAAVRGHCVELSSLWGREGAVVRERLLEAASPEAVLDRLEAALLERAGALEPDPGLASAVRALDGRTRVQDVAAELGRSERSLVRRVHRAVGLPPKRLARLRRFQRLLRSVAGDPSPDWARVALEHGYFDQAHLIRDFRTFAGLTPSRYRPRSAEDHNHVPE